MVSKEIARSWAEIDLEALVQNLEKAQSGEGGVMAIVKANAYGHGAVPVARALDGKVTMLGVAGVFEAQELVEAGVKSPLFLLGACLPGERVPAVEGGFRVSVSSVEEARHFSEAAEAAGKEVYCHLILDTGMGRIGFLESDWTEDMVRELIDLPGVVLEGIASHFPSADEDSAFTEEQTQQFLASVEQGKGWGLSPRWVHIANSAGILNQFGGVANLSRPGLLLYGATPLNEAVDDIAPVMALKSRVTLVRDLPAGSGVSYGRSYKCIEGQRVATVAIGYGDGYVRHVSGAGAEVLIRGQRCPLLGRVTMDQVMVDVSALDQVNAGDEVVLIGAQGEDAITVSEVAAWAETIPWEVFTGITPRVARYYTGESTNVG